MAFRPRIMVVEDDPQMLRLLGEALGQMGAEPHCVGSGPAAAALVQREKFDAVFLDWRMPVMDGLELARRVRSSKSNSHCPIVMLTAVTSPAAMKESFGVGVNFFLQKPVSIQQIRRLLNASRGMILEERRRYSRVPVQVKIVCEWEGQRVSGRSLNLSASGLLAELSPAPPAGTRALLALSLPGSLQPLGGVNADVTRVTSDGRYVGFQFTELSYEQSQQLKDFVEHAEEVAHV